MVMTGSDMKDSLTRGEALMGLVPPLRCGSSRIFIVYIDGKGNPAIGAFFLERRMDQLIVGCGYLGRRVAALGSAAGNRVFATTRSDRRAAELRGQGIVPLVCDVLAPQSLKVLPAVDTVVYSVGFDRAAGAPLRQVYVTGLGNVLAVLPEPRRLVYVSSTGVYGQCQGEDVDEDAATEPQEESGRAVLEAEHLLRQQLPQAVRLRFAGIYGPGRLLRRQA